jgi:hypothetical protein
MRPNDCNDTFTPALSHPMGEGAWPDALAMSAISKQVND